MSLSLLSLGIGSFLFHASLRQTLMWVDELSMLGLTWSLLQAVLTVRQNQATTRTITIALAVFFPLFSAFYVQSGQIIYQVIAFASGLVLVAAWSMYLLHFKKPGYPEAQRWDWNYRTWRSIAICLFGYGIWNIDLEFCAQLRKLRADIGLPWGWLFELHGWWHILTAIGGSGFMDVAREIRGYETQSDRNHRQPAKRH